MSNKSNSLNLVTTNFDEILKHLNSYEIILSPDEKTLDRHRLETVADNEDLDKQILCPTRSFKKDHSYLKNRDILGMINRLKVEDYDIEKAHLRPLSFSFSLKFKDNEPIEGLQPQLFLIIKRFGRCKIQSVYRQIHCQNQIPSLNKYEPINDEKFVDSSNFMKHLKSYDITGHVKQVSEYIKSLYEIEYPQNEAIDRLVSLFKIPTGKEVSNTYKNRYNLLVSQYHTNELAAPNTLAGMMNGGTGYLRELCCMSNNKEKYETHGFPQTSTYSQACKLLGEVSSLAKTLK